MLGILAGYCSLFGIRPKRELETLKDQPYDGWYDKIGSRLSHGRTYADSIVLPGGDDFRWYGRNGEYTEDEPSVPFSMPIRPTPFC